ncbi:kinase-like protein [Lichtheimia hyalospora FSU 10163]|nr:kinase-like protein [Lichtheimia hyalospora FSU 10163]
MAVHDVESDSSDCSNKFWTRPDTTNDESSEDMEKLVNRTSGETSRGSGTGDSKGSISKRRQTKMLLVSLIESFCRIHGDSPEANRRVFFLICQTLSSLGFIDAEFVDEMASVRSTFQGAFQKLFYTAVQTVRTQAFRSLEDGSTMMRTGSSTPRMIDYYHEEEDEFSYQTTHSTQCSTTHTGFSLMNVQNSRYRNDFVQVALLGRGGFASVWRARNKLDGIDYAIKRIRLGDDLVDDGYGMPYDKIFREIKHLARLEHHNVVRYYGSWLEYNEDASSSPPKHTHHVSDDEDSIFNGCDPTFEDDADTIHDNNTQDMSHIHFGNEDDDNDDEQDESTIHYHQQALCIPHTKTKRSRRSSTKSNGSSQRRRSSSSTSAWMLYIQMYLCPATLHDYIKYRNRKKQPIDSARNIEIFKGLLEGAAYIHEQGLVHRDLKPSNIFLGMPEFTCHRQRHHWRSSSSSSSSDDHYHGFSFDSVRTKDGKLRDCMWDEKWVPKIGDFGLAAAVMQQQHPTTKKPLMHHHFSPDSNGSPDVMIGSHNSFLSISSSYCQRSSNNDDDSSSSSSSDSSSDYSAGGRAHCYKRSYGVGTRTYAAPEQLAHPSYMYDDKVDIYSLGIILFELYQSFSTGMERACAIQQLRKGVFPDGFVEKYPKESALILWMMDDNPTHRPSAVQLLEFELFSSPEQDMYSQLQAQLEAQSAAMDNKDREMAALRDKMKLMEQENDAMHRRVDELQRKLNETSL